MRYCNVYHHLACGTAHCGLHHPTAASPIVDFDVVDHRAHLTGDLAKDFMGKATMLIKRRKGWELPESAATPEDVYVNRRQLLAAAGIGGAGLALAGAPRLARAQDADYAPPDDPTADLYPVPRNETFQAGRPLTSYEEAATYNNFYEFGSHKQIWGAAEELQIRPWTVVFDGMVEEERTVDIDTLIRAMPLEERVYRHRCVEAWAMTVPWSGFQMSHLVDYARPLSGARYVRMETFQDDSAPGFRQFWYPWPYVEGLTM